MVNSESWWWTGRPEVLRFMGVAKNRTWLSDWTELNWYPWRTHWRFKTGCNYSSNVINYILCAHSHLTFWEPMDSKPPCARPPSPSPSPRVCPSSCPLHQWFHPAISSSDALFSCSQSFPASGTFFQQVGCLHQVTKIPQLQLQHQSFQRVLRISFKICWFDLVAVQGNLRSLL